MSLKEKEKHPEGRKDKLNSKYTPILGMMQEGSQNWLILRHMIENGRITSMEAFMDYHITRLSGRIYELRHNYGLDIATSMTSSKSKNGLAYYAVYTLNEQGN